MAIGGGTTTGVLLGVPPKTFGVMNISTLIGVWFLMFLFPLDIVGHFLRLAYPVRVVVKTLATGMDSLEDFPLQIEDSSESVVSVSSIYCVFGGADAAFAQGGDSELPLAILCGLLILAFLVSMIAY